MPQRINGFASADCRLKSRGVQPPPTPMPSVTTTKARTPRLAMRPQQDLVPTKGVIQEIAHSFPSLPHGPVRDHAAAVPGTQEDDRAPSVRGCRILPFEEARSRLLLFRLLLLEYLVDELEYFGNRQAHLRERCWSYLIGFVLLSPSTVI